MVPSLLELSALPLPRLGAVARRVGFALGRLLESQPHAASSGTHSTPHATVAALEAAVRWRYSLDDPLFASVARRLEAAVRAQALKPRGAGTNARATPPDGGGAHDGGGDGGGKECDDEVPSRAGGARGEASTMGLDGVGFMAAEIHELWEGVHAVSGRNARLYAPHYNRVITQAVREIIGH